MRKRKHSRRRFKISLTSIVIFVALVVALAVFLFVFGDPDNFQGNNNDNQPIPGNFFGLIYRGGYIVPILMTILLTLLTFIVERYFAIRKAEGLDPAVDFVIEIQEKISQGNIDEALAECDYQKGSIANVVKSALTRYAALESEKDMTKDQKLAAIQKEVEEATSLELPGLEENLVVMATISSIATLLGLLGTVLGMIRAFAALANAGAPDAVALASGISEALINTAFGISTAAIAIVAYNYFTTRIDKITYCIDEAGSSIVQTYASKH
jgi:biopolymer transport protein ExbB